ncbi:MAG: HAD family hydrolase [Woeseiaceae bacterium]|jgi:putative hydrolase of the HAD superfamily
MNGIRTITLDLDDTLWAITPVIMRAEKELYEWLGEHYPKITALFSPSDLLQMRQEIVSENVEKSHDFSFLRRTVLGRIGAAAGYGDAPVEGAMEVFHALRNDVEVFPEVRPTLTALGEKYTVIAVTNGNANLERIGLRDLFDDVVAAASVGSAKPAQAIFDVAVEAGGADYHETLHVGDHPEVDVVGANEAGLKTAWVNRNGENWPDHLRRPDAIVRDVGELLSLLGVGH